MAVRLVDDVGVAHSAAEALALELWNLSGCLKTANEPATEQVASLAGEWLNNILNAYESGLPAFERVADRFALSRGSAETVILLGHESGSWHGAVFALASQVQCSALGALGVEEFYFNRDGTLSPNIFPKQVSLDDLSNLRQSIRGDLEAIDGVEARLELEYVRTLPTDVGNNRRRISPTKGRGRKPSVEITKRDDEWLAAYDSAIAAGTIDTVAEFARTTEAEYDAVRKAIARARKRRKKPR
jgi:hypothetical protein